MEYKIKGLEEIITKLLTDCVASRRTEDGVHEILNAYGGDSNRYKAADKSRTLDVAMDLANQMFNADPSVNSDLQEYFYSDKVEWNYRNAEDIATDILLGWNDFLKRYPKAR